MTFLQPQASVAHVGDRVEFKCSHDDGSLYVMLWYQQRAGGPMSLLGYKYDTNPALYEERFEGRAEILRESQTSGSLILRGVAESDSAVYFCSARAPWCTLKSAAHENPHDPLVPASRGSDANKANIHDPVQV